MKKTLKIAVSLLIFSFFVYESFVFVSAVNIKRYLYPVNHGFYEIKTHPVKALDVAGVLRAEPHLELHYICDYETGYGYLDYSRIRFHVKLTPAVEEKRRKAIAGVESFEKNVKQEFKGYWSEERKSGLKFYWESEEKHHDLWKGEWK